MGLLSNSLAGNLVAGPGNDMKEGCPDLCTFLRAVVTQGSLGGTTYDWTTPTVVAANVPCNIQNVSPHMVNTFASRGIQVSNKIFIPQGVATLLGDRVQNPSDSTQYFVVTFISDMAGEHLSYQVYVDLRQ